MNGYPVVIGAFACYRYVGLNCWGVEHRATGCSALPFVHRLSLNSLDEATRYVAAITPLADWTLPVTEFRVRYDNAAFESALRDAVIQARSAL